MCLDARDPYCGWDRKQRRCTTIEDSSNMSQWFQNITACPLRNQTADGAYGPWAPWQPCSHDDGEGTSTCLCRSRACDSPPPRCGGMEDGHPGHPGASAAQAVRLGLKSASDPVTILRPGMAAECVWGRAENRDSAMRRCRALSPSSGHHGRPGPSAAQSVEEGCTLAPGTEYQACNLESCPEVRRNTPWTPWVPVNITQGGARQEQRVRYICRAQLADPHELQLGKRKVETRFCPNDGTVTCETDSLVEELLKTPGVRLTGSGWSSWEMWSACTQECAKGYRTRKRTCTSAEGKSVPTACRGSPVEYQDCNPQPFNGAWACWSSWSQCSVPCGGGHYQRTRTCTSPTPANGGDICIGLHTEEALCNTHTCDGGWMAWSVWSECDDSGLQLRSRVCGAQSTPCVGNSSQHRDCNEIPAILPASSYEKDQQCGGFTLLHLIATGVSCFLGAGLLSFLVYVYCQRFHKPSQESAVIHPTTPNHLNYKGNTTPKNEKYTPMEFKTLNKNNLLPDERTNYFPSPLQQTNVYTTTYYPTALGKYDYRPDSSPSPCRTYNHS
ncbi:semaphorin-5B-like isoform X1 [Labeo rohita]|uniref:Semaphorin-5B-like isoform X1 n=1 Tax=Labeo rohita TaxID=84645 RepID=A0A498NHN3_LABRO|nr:semaphorin-5B-like isoform X1 [Labeo rohita]